MPERFLIITGAEPSPQLVPRLLHDAELIQLGADIALLSLEHLPPDVFMPRLDKITLRPTPEHLTDIINATLLLDRKTQSREEQLADRHWVKLKQPPRSPRKRR